MLVHIDRTYPTAQVWLVSVHTYSMSIKKLLMLQWVLIQYS